MSERNPNCKRDAGDSEFEASSTRVSPLKKIKLDDSTRDVVVFPVSASSVASSADSASGDGCSVTSAGEDDDQSSSISSGCLSGETNEIARNSPSSVVDLETHQISETEKSTSITSNFRKEKNPESEGLGETTEMESSSSTQRDDRKKQGEVRKVPTAAEVEDFFLGLENDDKQKRFIEKYNFDIVNDEPLEGRYKWDRIKP